MMPHDEWQLNTSRLGQCVLVFEQLDSTNAFALGLASDPANDGLVVLAGEQTAGRGQHGRTWSTPAGTGVLMSVLLFPPPELRRPALLTAWAAVSACELIRQSTGLQARIKWPNDVLIEGRKVCGILIEQAHGTVAGIGLNVNQTAKHFSAAGLPQAASLAILTGRTQAVHDVARQLIAILDQEYDLLCRGCTQDLEGRWRQCIGLIGKEVAITTATGTVVGALREISFEGLIVQLPDGSTRCVPPEGVRQLEEL
jgi:BirA family biotin operon repressor/biotin-[acetyl-CoA-carboxylase] ligase